MSEPERPIDAIVVGSGFAGAVTACRLAQAGQHVCILERGRRYLPADLPVLSEEAFGRLPDEQAPERPDRKIPDFARAFWQLGQGLWDVRDLGGMVVAQAAGYGGGSLTYANVHLRPPTDVFNRWPAEYRGDKLAGYFNLAAHKLQVETVRRKLPKTTQLELAARELGFESFAPPLAITFARCEMLGECCFGCKKEAKNTLDQNYLAEAERRGADIRTLAEVVAIEPADGGPGYTVTYRDHLKGGGIDEVKAPYVFLCAGAVNTTELLFRSSKLTIEERQTLGHSFYPNADALAVVFDCKEPQEADRGPTITSSLLYQDGTTWLLVQDGGIPSYLEPVLGFFRSPLWLNRNRFDETSRPPRTVSQRPPYAALPFTSLVDALSGLTGGAIQAHRSLPRELGQSLYSVARGGRTSRLARLWRLAPERLTRALKQLRLRLVYSAARAAEPTLEALLRDAGKGIEPAIRTLFKRAESNIGLPKTIQEDVLAQWALTLGLQLLWGSQVGLVGAIGEKLEQRFLPSADEVLGRGSDLLCWALDYRIGDGNTAVLLSMGRDSQPWRLGIERPAVLSAGSRIVGEKSAAAGILVFLSPEFVVLAAITGRFQRDEALIAGGRAFAICDSDGAQELSIGNRDGDQAMRAAALSAALGVLRLRPLPLQPSRTGRPWRRPDRLRAYPPPLGELPERTKQDQLLRDIAAKLGGELRTDPLWSFTDRRITVHPQGGCPMRTDSSVGVTSQWGEVFGCPGLYVMDAAAFPKPVGVNPSATILAVAERKVERFITDVLQRGVDWRDVEWAQAQGWATQRPDLDPLGNVSLQDQPVVLGHDPIGIEFNEIMKGTHHPAEKPSGHEASIETKLEVSISDLSKFLEQNRRGQRLVMNVSGDIIVRDLDPPLCSGAAQFAVLPAMSHLLFSAGRAESGGQWCTLEYQLAFEADTHTYVLKGQKDIRNDDGRFDVWEDTTTLFFTISRADQPDGPIRKGVLRLPAADFFGTQLPSFRATHVNGDAAREVWALSSFARFFFAHLVDVYVPTLDRVADAAQSIVERGHA